MSYDMLYTTNLFLRGMCAIYMFAFASLYLQIPGLYGENGILPAHLQLIDIQKTSKCLSQSKTLLCFSPIIGLKVSHMMELLSLLGILFSFVGLVWHNFCTSVLYVTLYIVYLSLYKVGQTFLWFQWDVLLLEMGVIAIIVAPVWAKRKRILEPHNIVTMWLVRWALFRLMFASGVVKLQSGCPTWWSLTALNYHYESQCIPTPLAWYAHQFPEWWQKLCVVGTYVIEIMVPFLFFSPIRSHKIFAFYCQVFLQVLIILTGNYNFFNLLTLVMCISLLDDVHLGYKKVRNLSHGLVTYIINTINFVAKWIGFSAILYYTMAYFSIRLSPLGHIESSVEFTRSDFDSFMSKVVPFSMVIGIISLLVTIAEALTSSLFDFNTFNKKMVAFSTALFYSIIAVFIFGISLVPYTSLEYSSKQHIWPVFRSAYLNTAEFEISSSYGLFRRMTGIRGRPEVVIEGSNSLSGPWQEYEFPYKVGTVGRALPFIAPHQPRVDWQMWFAALGTYHQHPWLVSMSYRLLKGESEVIALLDPSSSWLQSSPKYIRATKYIYHFTNYKTHNGSWWQRTLEGEYMPTYDLEHKPLLEYLRNQYLIETPDASGGNTTFSQIIIHIRNLFNYARPEVILWALFLSAIALIISKLYY